MEYIKHLRKDARLKEILKNQSPFVLKEQPRLIDYLIDSIVGQQLSTKAAAVIVGRFRTMLPKKASLEDILALEVEALRAAGLSYQKASYVHAAAKFFLEHKITDAKLRKMSDATILETLTQIKGVGKWTVQMMLMFGMGREDVFAPDDLGIRQAMQDVYDLYELQGKQLVGEMEQIAKAWQPYRTYACLHLWKYKDDLKKK
ncbi:MAG: DNA-3-methyladenine glycosylase 2 family protein [Hydrotalea sp.]|nr:DNA-3-methyladenine glycosylase 2 family protein [Hydrotalea sp.]